MKSFYTVFRALSLDVTLGAMVFSRFIAKTLDAEVPRIVYLELALAIWCIYTWDHLRDASVVEQPSNFRHQFHQRYAKPLQVIFFFCLLLGGVLVFLLPVNTLYMGTALCIFVVVYFAIIYLRPEFHHKETLIAIVYAAGIFLGPYSCLSAPIFSAQLLTSFLVTVLIAFINLMVFSHFEKDQDRQDGYPSLALAMGGHSKWFIASTLAVTLIVIGSAFFTSCLSAVTTLCFLLMWLILAAVYLFERLTIKGDYYRILGDGVFFVPLFFI